MENYRTLGRSGLRVSPLCLGGMTFGNDWGWGADEKTSAQIIRNFMDAGGNFIDTASVYTNGHSEKIIGDVIGNSSSLRSKTVIGTKFSGNIFPGNPNGGGAGTNAIMASCEQSLRRLKTDYIDLLSIHQWDWDTPLEETMRTLNRLVESGKVRYLGVSYAPSWKIAQAQVLADWKNWTPFIGLQIEYSLLERTIESELVPMAQELGLGITPWSPLKGGMLSGKYIAGKEKTSGTRLGDTGRDLNIDDRTAKILAALGRIAESYHTSIAAVALAWVMHKPGVASTIIGIRNPDQLDANIAATRLTLQAGDISTLDELSPPPPTFVTNHLETARMFQHGGIEINGRKPAALPLVANMQAGKY
ncbi:aldo/keto reductase [Mucilaginibacter sp. CAU 1740]|uniref:aldo/keto reductase n=1 Tax=Mucilaginibacter sp. CAU 1740 TaxID=3140365 RepID=UPI00325AD4C5